MHLPTAMRVSSSSRIGFRHLDVSRPPASTGIQPLTTSKGGGGGVNPCPRGRVVCAAFGYCCSGGYHCVCGTQELSSTIGSCTLFGEPGHQCCCTPW